MAFPASNDSLAKTWQETQQLAATVKSMAAAVVVDLDSDVTSQYLLNIYASMARYKLTFQQYAAVPGLVAYVKDQLDDQNLDISAEYTAMINAVEALRAAIIDPFPKDGAGFLLEKKVSAEGFSYRTFTPAQTASVKTAAQALVASIA